MIEIINCPFCDTENFTSKVKEGDWTIVKCKKCNFNYTNPRPKIEDLSDYYSEEYYHDERHRDKFFTTDGLQKINANTYLNRIIEIENLFNERGKILEIGSAWGEFLYSMNNRGWQIRGVELSSDGVAKAKELYNLDCFNGDYLNYKTDEMFDVICMYQTLEHIANPKEVLKKCYDELNDGGYIIIEVPHFKSFDMIFNRKRRTLTYDLPRHLNHFTPKFIQNELQKIGFKIESTQNYYPNFLFRLLSPFNRKKESSVIKNRQQSSKLNHEIVPLLTESKGIKVKIIKSIASLFPGWRFTIIGKKQLK